MTRYLLIAALLPAAALLFYVRKQDKIEAEPGGMIMKFCGFGALTIISAVILETLGGAVLGAVFPEDSLIYIALDNFLIIAGAEEGGKLFALKKGTWKSPNSIIHMMPSSTRSRYHSDSPRLKMSCMCWTAASVRQSCVR